LDGLLYLQLFLALERFESIRGEGNAAEQREKRIFARGGSMEADKANGSAIELIEPNEVNRKTEDDKSEEQPFMVNRAFWNGRQVFLAMIARDVRHILIFRMAIIVCSTLPNVSICRSGVCAKARAVLRSVVC
jgi:hypothetical protein